MHEYKEAMREFDASNMYVLGDIVDEFACRMAQVDKTATDNFLMRLRMYACPFKNRERAEYAVSKMLNDDGTKGAHWKYEEVEEIAKKHEIEDVPAFFYVLNMMYSDYYKSGRSVDDYVVMAIQFMDDKDAPDDKATRYYRAMHY